MRTRTTRAATLGLALLAVAASPAAADRHASSGPYAELDLGGARALGAAADHLAVGPSFGVRVGLELWSWLAVGVAATASTHEATVPPPPEGEYLQLYSAVAEARLTARVGWFAVFAQGGGGFAAISSNVLDKVGITEPDESLSLAISAGAGLEYQLQNRHLALGVAGAYATYPAFDATATVTVHSFLRYTY